MLVFIMYFCGRPLQRAAPRAGALQGGRLAYAIGVHTALNPAASKVWGRYVSVAQVSMEFQGSARRRAGQCASRAVGAGFDAVLVIFWRELNMSPVRHPA